MHFSHPKILELAVKVFRHGLDQVLHLSWCAEYEVRKYEEQFLAKLDKSFANEKDREYWSQDDLYRRNDKLKLKSLCKKKDVSVDGTKHVLVKRLIEKLKRSSPPVLDKYDGKLFSLPSNVLEIAKLSVYKLREIVRFYVLDCSTKDELAIRVGTL